jgi:hypothetical protein
VTITNPSVYLSSVTLADTTRTDDIVFDSPSTLTVSGGTLCDIAACERPFKLSGTATKVMALNYNPWLQLPKLTNLERDQIKAKAAGDVVFNVDRLNHFDGTRWREDVAFFPGGALTNAVPSGINYPAITATNRDSVPSAFRTEGAHLYNSTSDQMNYFDGTRWREQVAYFPGGATATAVAAGINLPQVTSTARDSIPTAFKVKGALIYNSTTDKLNFWNGSAWRVVDDKP